MELTKSAKKALLAVYKEYRVKLKSGLTRSQAIQFDEQDAERLLPDGDVMDELNSAGLIHVEIDDNFELTPAAIAKMEAVPGDIASLAVELALKLIT